MNKTPLAAAERTQAGVSIFRVQVSNLADGSANPLLQTAAQMNIKGVEAIHTERLYFLMGDLTTDDVEGISNQLLADPVTETYTAQSVHDLNEFNDENFSHRVEVTLLPGVTDPAAENLVRTAHLLGITSLQNAATGQRYCLNGDLTPDTLTQLADKIFSNPVVQRYAIDTPIEAPFVRVENSDDTVEIISLRNADDNRLQEINRERRLALDLAEMQAIRAYFQSENRDPSDAELEMLAQTWSEHCVHKTFRAKIDYTGPDGAQTIDGLLKTYIRAATEKVNKPWVRSAFVDNAGIIAFDDQFDIAFKVETHNHPSALEPFGGANTGVGGVIRDVLGVSARPIANTDILCFGPPDLPESQLPKGVLHPRRIADGVIHGVEDYGNKMGIPTVNGAILYHEGYTANPLVFCGCLGILPHGSHITNLQPGDFVVVIGGRTGRDGLRGATFSSMEMDQTTEQIAGSSVQIGNPIQEKQVQEVVLRARDEKLYNAITDCGAGGLSSAVGEMANGVGATIQLADVPLKYPGLRPWEIWLSEAQERMVLAVPPEKWMRFQEICAGQDVEAVNIGTFEATGRLKLHYNEKIVGDLSVEFLHEGIPQRHLKAVWSPPTQTENTLSTEVDLADSLLKLLAHPDIRSKESVIRRYDHEVQGATAVKPLVGTGNHGPSDASVIVPLDALLAASGTQKAVALANGVAPLYGEIDPYAMAFAAVDEAIRNLVAVGTDPDQIAILDNFCWGNPLLEDRLGSLVRCTQGCHDAAVAYGVPFISGKDSLNNEYTGADGKKHAIPGTLLISAVGIVPDVTQTVTMDLKTAGNLLYVIGETRNEMGGSHYNLVNGIANGDVPQPNSRALETYRVLHRAIQAGLVQSSHDASEGGLAVALAEMCIAGSLGADVSTDTLGVYLDGITDFAPALFSESQGRLIVEIKPRDVEAFEALMSDVLCVPFGQVTEESVLHIECALPDSENNRSLEFTIADLEKAWCGETITDSQVTTPADSSTDDIRRQTIPMHAVSTRVGSPKVLILHANGSNRDRDAFLACQIAGAEPEIVHINQLTNGERQLLDYHMLIVPGGFSYGDDLGAGTLWALDLQHSLGQDVQKFITEGRPVMGICNGFQTLVKSGLLPGETSDKRDVTLTFNQSAHFECRWVYLQPNPHSPCLFTEGLTEPIYCPVAHGEGRIAASSEDTLNHLWRDGFAALTYTDESGQPALYPANPNGSAYNIAGLTNTAGNVFGLMPHPEDHIFPWQHPRWRRGERGLDGLRLFKNGVKYA